MSESVSSHGSAQSTSLAKIDCPYCKKEIQGRYLFNHIRVYHISEFLENTQKKWITEAAEGRPLKVYWQILNDFDEKETKIVYGCLSSNKCFMTEERGMRHFKHNPEHLKKHNSELKKLKKEKQVKEKREREEKEKRNPAVTSYQTAIRQNNPKIVEGLWRAALHWKRACDLAVSLGNFHFKEEFEFVVSENPLKVCKWKDQFKEYLSFCAKAKKLLEENDSNAEAVQKVFLNFWRFLQRWTENIISLTALDPRLDPKNKDSIVLDYTRNQDVMDEEFFYTANSDMPMPIPEDFVAKLPPVKEEEEKKEEPLPIVTLPGLSAKQTNLFLEKYPPGSSTWKKAFTTVVSNEICYPKEAQILQQQYPPVLSNTKRAPKQT